MWQLKETGSERRMYVNSVTGSQCVQSKCYTDRDGNTWWQFEDLLTLPYTRQFASTKVSSLYQLGLSIIDLRNFFTNIKAVLKSADTDKYEKSFKEVLDLESKVDMATNAVKQQTGLVCVYFTINDEPIDSFLNDIQMKKLSLMENDPDMHGFFLKRQIELIERYMQVLERTSQIVSPNQTNGVSH